MILKYEMKLEDVPLRMLGDYDIDRILEKEENIGHIEDLLRAKTKDFLRIKEAIGENERKKNRLLGREIDNKEFEGIYEDISVRVNEFLGVGSVERPEWALSKFFKNQYDPKVRLIFLNNEHRSDVIVAGSHEYTHHVCKVNGIYDGQHCFAEGICRAAQREVARQYSEEENNTAFLLNISDYDVGELKSVYIHLAKTFSRPVYKSLIEMETNTDSHELGCRIKGGLPSIHARGNVFYMLKELREGNDFYRDIFK